MKKDDKLIRTALWLMLLVAVSLVANLVAFVWHLLCCLVSLTIIVLTYVILGVKSLYGMMTQYHRKEPA